MDANSVTPQDITLVTGAAHNPKEPRHFMRLKPVSRRVRPIGSLRARSAVAPRPLPVSAPGSAVTRYC